MSVVDTGVLGDFHPSLMTGHGRPLAICVIGLGVVALE